ncbi:prolipoprotein diacylglyceryl transferase [Flexivirga endophytica]|uniref:Phosphatidylglycerol--prolipoprotein diacylglyceryl transferase n=1 Tax=Flexivirga endophytica TaxID=1849103 RepID=A0A916T6B6_9MICO|nr:prolipoprotein diacylglyceryl transferase [Flexivirga endophytica]GGB33343.1 prolipoprotein diacylglyceryl transferase [Flexivirga endophytica]GHB41336.1 prolipoprotein diacylglyceryl transferase [Flexivirga endophytica]
MIAEGSYFPSPTVGVFWLGPFPIRMYALCILAGIVLAIWVTGRRMEDRGYQREDALNVAWWAVPFGIVGGRIYNVITSPQPYFGKHGNPWDAFAIWHGGLGIWGAIAIGALGAYIGCRRNNIRFLDFADAGAPGVVLAQALGRWGNYFNNELHGRTTDLPWRLKIYEWDETAGHAVKDSAGHPIVKGYFQPTFLYESLFCLVIALIVVWLDRRYRLGRGKSFFLYVTLYPIGRIWMEWMRNDPANHILGQRVNVWVCVLVFIGGLVGLVINARRHPDGEREPIPGSTPTDDGAQPDAAAEDPSPAQAGPVKDPGPPHDN